MVCTNKNKVFCYFINVYSILLMFEARLSHESSQSPEVRPLEFTFSGPQMVIVCTQIKSKAKPIILCLHGV